MSPAAGLPGGGLRPCRQEHTCLWALGFSVLNDLYCLTGAQCPLTPPRLHPQRGKHPVWHRVPRFRPAFASEASAPGRGAESFPGRPPSLHRTGRGRHHSAAGTCSITARSQFSHREADAVRRGRSLPGAAGCAIPKLRAREAQSP